MKKKRTSSKKAQVSVYALLGIIIIITITVVVSLAIAISEVRLKQQAEQAVTDYLASANIGYYIYTCLDTSVKQALDEFSKQGGKYTPKQGGYQILTEPGQTHIPYNETYLEKTEYFNVTYSIENTGYCEEVHMNPPEYPYPNTPLTQIRNTYQPLSGYGPCTITQQLKYSGPFGQNNLTKICYLAGENIDSIGTTPSPCKESFTPILKESAEYQISQRISNLTKSCINFTLISIQGNHNITVLNDPLTNISITKDSFISTIQYPFLVKLENREPILIRHTFKYETNLRIIQILRYLTKLITEETQNIFNNIKTDYASINDFDTENMNLEIIEFTNCEDCPYKYDKIIKLTDNLSKINEKPLTFYTAIKNRRPAMDYIHKTEADNDIDIAIQQNETIKLEPLGLDPDETKIEYFYTGWKENYDQTFDYDGIINDSCNLSKRALEGTPFESKEDILGCMITNPDLSPHEWTNSILYNETNRSAQYKTNLSDIGYHNVTITTQDISGLRDWQNIQILVIDTPKAELKTTSIYSDVAEGAISIEDPFILNASGSRPSLLAGGSITYYVWRAYLGTLSGTLQFIKSVAAPQDYLYVPLSEYNIQNIHIRNLTQNKTHTIELTINTDGTSSLTGKETIQVNVTSCLPHRNETNPIFPYNKSDAFYANHACCLADEINDPETYKLASPSTDCYSKDMWGRQENLTLYYVSNLKKSDELNEYFTIASITPEEGDLVGATPYPDGGDFNDIYKLEFKRSCDGNRGNICAGDITAGITQIKSCDGDSAEYPNALCIGPPPTLSSSEITECIKYDIGETFNTIFKGDTIGLCDEIWECSTPTEKYNNVGNAECQATCDGEGTCTHPINCKCTSECAECITVTDSGIKLNEEEGKYYCSSDCDLDAGSKTMCQYKTKRLWGSGDPDIDYYLDDYNTCHYRMRCLSSGYTEQKHTDCTDGKECTATGCTEEGEET